MRKTRFITLICSMFAVISTTAEIRHYDFSGTVSIFSTNFTPAGASAAFQSIQDGDKFILSFDIDSAAPPQNYPSYYINATKNIRFQVPARGVNYFSAAQDLRVLYTVNNPYDIRWDVEGVEPSVNMIFWARDFSNTALTGDAIPSPLNLDGFHTNGIVEIGFYNGGLIFNGNLVPSPTLRLQHNGSTNAFAWENHDTAYHTLLQSAGSLNGPWTTITNPVPAISNRVDVIETSPTNKFYRLLVQ